MSLYVASRFRFRRLDAMHLMFSFQIREFFTSRELKILVEVVVRGGAEPEVIRQELRRSDGCDGNLLVANVLPRHRLDGFDVDGVDARKELIARHALAVRQELSANLFRDGAGARLGVQEQGRLERLLRAREIRLLWAVDEVLELAHHGERRVVEVFEVVARDGHAKEAGVGVVGVERHERVTELVGVEGLRERGHHIRRADGLLVPAAEHGLHNHERNGVRRVPGRTLEGDGKVARRHVVVADANLTAGKVTRVLGNQRLGARALSREIGESLLRELDELIVVHSTGTDQYHTWRRVVRLNVRLQVFLRHGANALFRPENGGTERGVLERRRVQVIKQNLLDILFDLFHLAQDDSSLTLDLRFFQRRVLQNITQNIHRRADILLHNLGVVRRLLTARVRVQVSAHVFNLLLETSRRAALRTLESHVFQEVRGTVRRRVFIPRTRVDPHANSRGFRVRRRFRRHSESIRERRHLFQKESIPSHVSLFALCFELLLHPSKKGRILRHASIRMGW